MSTQDDMSDKESTPGELSALRSQIRALESEVGLLRRKLVDTPKRVTTLEERLLETKGQLAQAVSQNEKLTFTLREAREQVATLREEVEKLTQPPSAYGTFIGTNDDGTVDVHTNGRKVRVSLHPDLRGSELEAGAEVVLNESLNVVMSRDPGPSGEVGVLKEVLSDGLRALVTGRADEERVVDLGDHLKEQKMRAGDSLLLDARANLVLERLPRPEVDELLLEEAPDVTYAAIGGLDGQIEQITDAVELPYLHQDLFREYDLPAPKGILLYGPPGCGKTLIAKAVANSLANKVAEASGDKDAQSFFINMNIS